MERSRGDQSCPFNRSMMSSRESTRWGRFTKASSRLNSLVVRSRCWPLARLRSRRHRSDFDEAETHREQTFDAARVFVESGRKSHAIAELQSHRRRRLIDSVYVSLREPRAFGEAQSRQRDLVRGFRRQQEHQTTQKFVHGTPV